MLENSKNISKKEVLSQDTSSNILMRNGVAASRSLNSGASIHSSHSVAPTHHLNNGISTHTPLLKTSAANVVAADIANNFGSPGLQTKQLPCSDRPSHCHYNQLQELTKNILTDIRTTVLCSTEKITKLEVECLNMKHNLLQLNQRIDDYERTMKLFGSDRNKENQNNNGDVFKEPPTLFPLLQPGCESKVDTMNNDFPVVAIDDLPVNNISQMENGVDPNTVIAEPSNKNFDCAIVYANKNKKLPAVHPPERRSSAEIVEHSEAPDRDNTNIQNHASGTSTFTKQLSTETSTFTKQLSTGEISQTPLHNVLSKIKSRKSSDSKNNLDQTIEDEKYEKEKKSSAEEKQEKESHRNDSTLIIEQTLSNVHPRSKYLSRLGTNTISGDLQDYSENQITEITKAGANSFSKHEENNIQINHHLSKISLSNSAKTVRKTQILDKLPFKGQIILNRPKRKLSNESARQASVKCQVTSEKVSSASMLNSVSNSTKLSNENDNHVFRIPHTNMISPESETAVVIKGEKVSDSQLEEVMANEDIEFEDFFSYSQTVDDMQLDRDERSFLLGDKKKNRKNWNKFCKDKEGVKYAPLVKKGGCIKAVHRSSIGKQVMKNILNKRCKMKYNVTSGSKNSKKVIQELHGDI